jgi:(S)-2-hydroxyglutarate dehydrogenase
MSPKLPGRMCATASAPGECDIAVVGGGIVGLAVARELAGRRPEATLAVLERSPRVGMGQTARNSGVIHAGIYYAPGSLKARLCVAGARLLYEYCDRHGVPYERCGKLVVARHRGELARLDELERRGRANAVPGLRRLSGEELREVEPHARGLAALHSPETGIVDFGVVARSLADGIERRGVPVVTGCSVRGVTQAAGRLVVRHGRGETRARFAVFCAGLASDRLAVATGASPDPRIVPFRGTYLYLRAERRALVRGLIYPVPDPALPFLGVHLTRHIDGEVSLGPSALLWPRGPTDVAWPGTLRLARRYWRTGLRELRHAVSRRAFASEAAEYVPELSPGDFRRGFAGIRAQALGRDGALVDDFVISETERALHVRNAPSPAATSALALAGLIADGVERRLD